MRLRKWGCRLAVKVLRVGTLGVPTASLLDSKRDCGRASPTDVSDGILGSPSFGASENDRAHVFSLVLPTSLGWGGWTWSNQVIVVINKHCCELQFPHGDPGGVGGSGLMNLHPFFPHTFSNI